eukprot:4451134-Pyramimonas_sp.AAC.1
MGANHKGVASIFLIWEPITGGRRAYSSTGTHDAALVARTDGAVRVASFTIAVDVALVPTHYVLEGPRVVREHRRWEHQRQQQYTTV